VTSKSFLQTVEWANWQKSLGREVFEYEENNISATVIKHNLPLGKSYLYIPRGPEMDFNSMIGGEKNPVANFLDWLKTLAKGEKAIFVKIEPANDHVAQVFAERGFRKSKKEIQPSRTVILDLGKSEEELLAGMHHKTRYNIKVAERRGVEIREISESEIFWRLMKKTTKRDKFSSHPREYYEKMVEKLRDGAVSTKIFAAFAGGKPAAAAIILFYGDAGYYLHGASDYNFHSQMAPFLLHWHIIRYLKEHGYKEYDFWGIDARKWPGVTRFKLGWGGQVVEYPGSFNLTISWLWHRLYRLFGSLK
jgi:lipid II:glycine glycyltransferase (peptidoglycan interpeptide bridge formation enzyme)